MQLIADASPAELCDLLPVATQWELAEMTRRFVLVGLFVVVQPGKVLQVFLGTTFSAFFLMVQLQVLIVSSSK